MRGSARRRAAPRAPAGACARMRSDLFVEGVLTAVRDDDGHLLGYSKLMKDVTDKRRIESRARAAVAVRACRAQRGRAREPHEGRVPGDAEPRAAHAAERDSRLVAGAGPRRRRERRSSRDGLEGHRAQRARAGADHRGPARHEQHHLRQGAPRDAERRTSRRSSTPRSTRFDPPRKPRASTCSVALDPLAAPVSGDPNRLQQVFWNLLTNAVKFTPKDGRVSVTLERVNSHLEVSVTDTGEGIDRRSCRTCSSGFARPTPRRRAATAASGSGSRSSSSSSSCTAATSTQRAPAAARARRSPSRCPCMAVDADPAERHERASSRASAVPAEPTPRSRTRTSKA